MRLFLYKMKFLDRVALIVSGGALCLITILIVFDVSLRFFIGFPLSFSYDLISLYLTPLLFFLGVGPTYWRNEHLAVDLIVSRLSFGKRRLLELGGAVIGGALFGLLSWVGFERAWASFKNGEAIASIVPWPAWASYAIVPFGGVFMTVVCFARFFCCVSEFRSENTSSAPLPPSFMTGVE